MPDVESERALLYRLADPVRSTTDILAALAGFSAREQSIKLNCAAFLCYRRAHDLGPCDEARKLSANVKRLWALKASAEGILPS